jgi:hypothetical protein
VNSEREGSTGILISSRGQTRGETTPGCAIRVRSERARLLRSSGIARRISPRPRNIQWQPVPPAVGQQLCDPQSRVGADALEHAAEVDEWVDLQRPAGRRDTEEDRRSPAANFAPGEQPDVMIRAALEGPWGFSSNSRILEAWPDK